MKRKLLRQVIEIYIVLICLAEFENFKQWFSKPPKHKINISMLIPRIYEPNDEKILYHYCDASAFHAICTNKKMRFSDLFSMNDFMEMHWG